jgi:dienelactone hydrolase
LWRDFDETLDDPEISWLHEREENGAVSRSFYFTALNVPDGKVRVHCRLLYLSATKERYDDKMPLVIVSGDMYSSEVLGAAEKIRDSGFAVLTYDVFGTRETERFTLYPDSLGYANLETAKENLFAVVDPKDTCWYVWAAVSRYLLTACESVDCVDASRIGFFGVGYGGNIAYMLAATDNRINTALVLGGDGFGEPGTDAGMNQTGLFDEEQSGFLYSLSRQAYIKLVKKPLLLHLNTNAEDGSFDRDMHLFSRLPSQLKNCLSVSPYRRQAIGFHKKDTLLEWLRYHVLHEDNFPAIPTLEIVKSEDKLYAKLSADTSLGIMFSTVHYAYDTLDPVIRNWYRLDTVDMGEGEYTARLEVINENQTVYAFGSVIYDNGVCVSTRLSQKNTKGLDLALSGPAKSRLVFDAKNGYDCFLAEVAGELISTDKELCLSDGPLGISGITAVRGDLTTFKLADPRFYGYDGDLLQFSFFSAETQTVHIELHERTESGRWGDIFTATVNLSGGESWQKVTLDVSAFKTRDGRLLDSWDGMAQLALKRERDLLLNTMIWV